VSGGRRLPAGSSEKPWWGSLPQKPQTNGHMDYTGRQEKIQNKQILVNEKT